MEFVESQISLPPNLQWREFDVPSRTPYKIELKL